MGSLVDELQRCAMDRSVSLPDLLRRALVTAKKLGLEEFEQWIAWEMDGYPEEAEIPEYRHVIGSVKMLNPIHGWIPVQFENPAEAARLSRMPMNQALAELDAVAGGNNSGSVMISYGSHVERALLRSEPLMAGVALQVPVTRVTAILDAVRNAVLKWSLQLETDGITGNATGFTAEEKQVAREQHYIVNNFYGAVGHAQLQQHSPGAQMAGRDLAIDHVRLDAALALLREVHKSLGNTDEAGELQAELETIVAQQKSPKPKPSIIRGALSSAKRIAESATGGVLGRVLAEKVSSFDWGSLL